jgi:hypothetical protein
VFEFKTNEESEFLCSEIAREMHEQFYITIEEAIVRIHAFWSRFDFIDENDIRYHVSVEYWCRLEQHT